MNSIPHKVLLPAWIFQQAGGNNEEIKRFVLEYMRRYPNYKVIEIRGSFAICEKDEKLF